MRIADKIARRDEMRRAARRVDRRSRGITAGTITAASNIPTFEVMSRSLPGQLSWYETVGGLTVQHNLVGFGLGGFGQFTVG
jgi:hypothetical protein